MKATLTLFKREVKGYLLSPIATIVIIAFLLLSGGLFMSQFFLVKLLDMRAFFALLPFILAIVLPAVSMRLWAEDRQLNTLELLLSLPIRPAALVLGKFLSAVTFLLLLLVSTWMIPLMLMLLGRPDFGPIVSGYLGALLLGALFLAVGQFISGLCRDQIVAFILGLFACLSLFLIGNDFIASTVDGWWPGLGGFLQEYLGIARHFSGFEKGVVDGRDAAYFLLLIAAFLTLNGIWMEGRLKPRARIAFATACALCVGIAMAAQAVFQYLPLGRFDWTENRIYTVAPATREILTGLEVPVTVKLYLSPAEKMPTAMRTMERDLRDALEELRLVSGGKLQYEVLHMEATAAMVEPQSNQEELSLEEKLGRKGIRPFQVQSIEADEVGVRLVYAAAAIAYKDRPEEVIPQLVPNLLDRWEYLLISKIYRLTLDEELQVAVVTPYEQKSLDPKMAALMQQLGLDAKRQGTEDDYRYLPGILQYEGYRVLRIRITEQDPIPSGIHALVIAEPGQMNDRQRYEVSRYLVEGGALFVAAQRYRYDYIRERGGIVPMPQAQPIGLDPLLAHWGAEVDQDILLDELSRVISVSSGAHFGPFSLSMPVKAPIHVEIGQEQMNAELGITSSIPPIFYLWGSPLVIHEERLTGAGLTAVTLMHSSRRSQTVPYAARRPLSVEGGLAQSGEGELPLGVLVSGTFPDLYAGKPVPAWPKPEPEAGAEAKEAADEPEADSPIVPVTSKPGQLILVGCDEMFKENYIESGGQLAFFLNAVDTLISGGKLVGIRNKQQNLRTFPAPTAAKKAWLRFLTLGLMPIIIIVVCVVHAAWRRRLREAYGAL